MPQGLPHLMIRSPFDTNGSSVPFPDDFAQLQPSPRTDPGSLVSSIPYELQALGVHREINSNHADVQPPPSTIAVAREESNLSQSLMVQDKVHIRLRCFSVLPGLEQSDVDIGGHPGRSAERFLQELEEKREAKRIRERLRNRESVLNCRMRKKKRYAGLLEEEKKLSEENDRMCRLLVTFDRPPVSESMTVRKVQKPLLASSWINI